jgi:hypothetical protein
MITSVSRRNAPENVTRDLLCGGCANFVCYVYAANLDCYGAIHNLYRPVSFTFRSWKNQGQHQGVIR